MVVCYLVRVQDVWLAGPTVKKMIIARLNIATLHNKQVLHTKVYNL